jgi:hypothetical protein
MAQSLKLPLRLERRPPRGIYAAMNEALSLVQGQLVGFMHAGDRYLPGGLTLLVEHWLEQGKPAAVFGQAWVQPIAPSAWVRPWLTPPTVVIDLRRWLLWMVPCHQAFLFEVGFARSHPYATTSLVADRVVMRAALATCERRAYLRRPVCQYRLGGASSALPRWLELPARLLDSSRSWPERGVELPKACVGAWFSPLYPLMMRWRALLWASFCGDFRLKMCIRLASKNYRLLYARLLTSK